MILNHARRNAACDGLAGQDVQFPVALYSAALAPEEPEVFDHEPELVFEWEVRHPQKADTPVTYRFALKEASIARQEHARLFERLRVRVASEISVPSLV